MNSAAADRIDVKITLTISIFVPLGLPFLLSLPEKVYFICSHFFSHSALCETMVTSVSPSWTSTDAKRASSSLVSLQEMAFAIAVTDAVISQAFILSPHDHYIRRVAGEFLLYSVGGCQRVLEKRYFRRKEGKHDEYGG